MVIITLFLVDSNGILKAKRKLDKGADQIGNTTKRLGTYCKWSVFREENCLRDICVAFRSLFSLILHLFFSLIDYID